MKNIQDNLLYLSVGKIELTTVEFALKFNFEKYLLSPNKYIK